MKNLSGTGLRIITVELCEKLLRTMIRGEILFPVPRSTTSGVAQLLTKLLKQAFVPEKYHWVLAKNMPETFPTFIEDFGRFLGPWSPAPNWSRISALISLCFHPETSCKHETFKLPHKPYYPKLRGVHCHGDEACKLDSDFCANKQQLCFTCRNPSHVTLIMAPGVNFA